MRERRAMVEGLVVEGQIEAEGEGEGEVEGEMSITSTKTERVMELSSEGDIETLRREGVMMEEDGHRVKEGEVMGLTGEGEGGMSITTSKTERVMELSSEGEIETLRRGGVMMEEDGHRVKEGEEMGLTGEGEGGMSIATSKTERVIDLSSEGEIETLRREGVMMEEDGNREKEVEEMGLKGEGEGEMSITTSKTERVMELREGSGETLKREMMEGDGNRVKEKEMRITVEEGEEEGVQMRGENRVTAGTKTRGIMLDIPRRLMSEIPRRLMSEIPRRLMSEIPRRLMSEIPRRLMSEIPRRLMSEIPRRLMSEMLMLEILRRIMLEILSRN